jgi:DNA-binding IclR family transcriptional regulator
MNAAATAEAMRAERSAETRSPDTVSALERGVAVLRCFTEDRRVLGPTELSRLTGIPRPTVTRLATTLVSLGLLQPERGGDRYRLGAGVVSLARVFLAGLDVRAIARAPMQALAEALGCSVYLAVRDGLEMVLVEAARPRSSMLAARLDVGSRVPLPNAALGRAYLGAVDDAERRQLVESMRLARGSDWPALEQGLQRALADARRDGWSLSCGEFHREINSVAVPLVGPTGDVMALNCGGPAFVFGEQRLRDEVAPRLRELAQAIAHDIGGHVPAASP